MKSQSTSGENEETSFCKSLYITIVLAFGSMIMGLVSAYHSPTKISMDSDFELKPGLSDAFNYVGIFAGAIGSVLSNPLVRFFGRRNLIFYSQILTFIFFLLLGFTTKEFLWAAFLLRALLGVMMGILAAVCSMYIVELAPIKWRGAFGAFHQLFVTIGNLYIYLLGLSFNWRTLTFACLLVPIVQLILICTVPDHRFDDVSEKESIFQKKFLGPLVHSIIFVFCQQFSGINAILTNLQTFFGDVGLNIKENECACVVGSVHVFVTCFSSFFINKLGRKTTWIISSCGLTIALLAIWLKDIADGPKWIPLVAMIVYMTFFGLGFGQIPWLIVPELFPDSVRSTFQSIATFLNWVCAGAVTLIWPVLNDKIGEGYGLFCFSVVCVVSIIYGIFLMPETKNVELGEKSLVTESLLDT